MQGPDRTTRRDFVGRVLGTAAAGLVTPTVAQAAAQAGSAKPADAGWEVGCYTRPWDKQEYRVALDAIAEAGFKHAGLMTTKSETRLVISHKTTVDEARKIGEEVKKRGMDIPSVYGGGIPVDKSLQAGIDGMRRLIDACAAAGAKSILMGGIGNKKLYEAYYKAIAETCDYAAEKKIPITLKPHGGLNATGPQCRKTVEEVHHKNFGIWYDPGNIFYYSDGKLDPVDDAATVDGLVFGMCIKDYKHPKNVMVTAGTGRVNFKAVLARLKKGGFDRGSLVVETLKDTKGDLAATLEEAKKARKFVQGLCKEA